MLKYEQGNIVTGNYPVFCQQVNCKGKMGAGLAKQIRDKYPEVYTQYLKRCEYGNNLGQIQIVICNDKRICINMFAQDGYGRTKRYTNYKAFQSCLDNIMAVSNQIQSDIIAFPYGIGCGLAGGDWYIILGMLTDFANRIKQDVVIVNYV